MIKVYFETDSVSEQVATFESENHYMVCLPILKEIARQDGWLRVTESVEEKVWYNNNVHINIQAIISKSIRSALLTVKSLPLSVTVFTNTYTNFFQSQIIYYFAN